MNDDNDEDNDDCDDNDLWSVEVNACCNTLIIALKIGGGGEWHTKLITSCFTYHNFVGFMHLHAVEAHRDRHPSWDSDIVGATLIGPVLTAGWTEARGMNVSTSPVQTHFAACKATDASLSA